MGLRKLKRLTTLPLGALALLAILAPTTSGAAQSPQTQPRIVGGSPTTVGEWPWQGALVLDETFGGNDFERYFCSASLIHPHIVMTAGHCVAGPGPDLEPDEAEVILGRTQLSAGGGTEHEISAIYVHDSFRIPLFFGVPRYDVALISLEQPSSRPRILIAGADERALWSPGLTAFVSGWGATSEGGNASDVLREVAVEIIGDSTCGSSSYYGSDFIPRLMVCAGFPQGGKDSCQGDSGGPLQSPAAGGLFRQTGIVSWGEGCARPSKPGVYSRIADNPLRDDVREMAARIEDLENLPHFEIIGSAPPPPGEPGEPSEPGEQPGDFRCRRRPATIVASPGDEPTLGTPGPDVIVGTLGPDVIRSLGGKDLICALRGADRAIGGKGADRIFGQTGPDRLKGKGGRDLLAGGKKRDVLRGGAKRDRLRGGRGADRLLGGKGNDSCKGGVGNDALLAC